MKRFLYFLLALLGFVVTATSCRVEYGCPPVERDDNKAEDVENVEHTNNNNSTERV